jgi:hypothetical protein
LRSTIRARSMVPTSKGGHGFACEAVASTGVLRDGARGSRWPRDRRHWTGGGGEKLSEGRRRWYFF